MRPTISLSYGWGSNTEYEKQKYRIWSRQLQQVQDYYITVKNVESVRDFSLTLSVRKDFDWYDVLGKNDNITLTPVLLLYSGTQQFGFNTSYSYTFNTVRVNSFPATTVRRSNPFRASIGRCNYSGQLHERKFLLQPQVCWIIICKRQM